MTYQEFDTYYNECKEKGLTKIKPVIEVDPEYDLACVTKTEETYVLYCEGADLEPDVKRAADELINEVRLVEGFKKAEIKEKAGKENKAGEVVKNASYTVIITREHF